MMVSGLNKEVSTSWRRMFLSRFVINEETREDLVLPQSQQTPQSDEPLDDHGYAIERDDPYEFEEYEYDLPPEGGFFKAVLLFPFAVIVSLLETLWDVMSIIPYLLGELIVQIKDLGFAIFFFASEFVFLLFRLFVAPILFVATDPVGFFCYQADRIRYLAWSLAWHIRLLWADLWEQIDDVGRLVEMAWWHVLNAFGLTTAELPPVHAVPVREVAGLPSPTRKQMRIKQSMTADAKEARQDRKLKREQHTQAQAERRRSFSAVTNKTNTNEPARHRPRFQIRPIETTPERTKSQPAAKHPEFKVSLRTKLADENESPDYDDFIREPSESWYGLYCCTCPRCHSDEVYPIHSTGKFAESLVRTRMADPEHVLRTLSGNLQTPGPLTLGPHTKHPPPRHRNVRLASFQLDRGMVAA